MQLQAISLWRWLIRIDENIERLDMIVGLNLRPQSEEILSRNKSPEKRLRPDSHNRGDASAAARLCCNSTIFATVNAVCPRLLGPVMEVSWQKRCPS